MARLSLRNYRCATCPRTLTTDRPSPACEGYGWSHGLMSPVGGEPATVSRAPVLFEQLFLSDGRPVVPERHRWAHACGQHGTWTSRVAARIGGPGHGVRCRAPPAIAAGRTYRIASVGAGHDAHVVVPDGEPPSDSGHNWLVRDSDDAAGARRLVAFVRACGGIVRDPVPERSARA